MSIYLELTKEFNQGRLRAIISSGQAVVLHHLAIMSKDGDWILREDAEATGHVLGVLARHGARYRYGAPLDARWLAGGWSSHLEFQAGPIRVRTDFFTRPPRVPREALAEVWAEMEGKETPFVNALQLAEIKKTNREKDYAVIGELARLMPIPHDQLLYSRSARDLMALQQSHAALAAELVFHRPVLGVIGQGREALERALDAERRDLMHANEQRLLRYAHAASRWEATWPAVAGEIRGRSLVEAHEIMKQRAEGVLPFRVPGEDPS